MFDQESKLEANKGANSMAWRGNRSNSSTVLEDHQQNIDMLIIWYYILNNNLNTYSHWMLLIC